MSKDIKSAMQYHDNATVIDNINIINRNRREVAIVRGIEAKKGTLRYSVYYLFLYSFVFKVETRSK